MVRVDFKGSRPGHNIETITSNSYETSAVALIIHMCAVHKLNNF